MNDDKKFAYTTTFNSILKRFIKFACNKSIALKTNRVKDRVSMLINDAPLTIMESAGPYILKYAKSIKDRDEKFFMTVDLSEHYDNKNDKTKKDIVALIDQIRKIYKKCSDDEKAHLCDLSDDLLIAYCTYLTHQRDIEKNNNNNIIA
jgi:hypothetical protein